MPRSLPCLLLVLSTSAACSGDRPAGRPALERLPAVMLGGQPLPFSRAVRVGEVLYVSGQVGLSADETLPEGMEAQARQAMDAIGGTLEMAGLDWTSVFHCTVMLEDMADWPAFNRVYATYVDPDHLPARSAFGTDGLALGALVEIECQAYAPETP
ncbi:MAG: RidA family protein [Acidobacteriota bacterium]|nr:RidA family protein [Acidobacteriota bacterium]